MGKLTEAVGFIGFALYLFNYYGYFATILLSLLVLLRKKIIPLGRRVAVNVSAGIIAPILMIYPLLKHGLVINKDLLTFIGISAVLTLFFSRLNGCNGSVTHVLLPLLLGNTAVYLKISPTIALPILFTSVLIISDGILLAILLRKTPNNIKYVIGGYGLRDGLIALPGLMFLTILYVVLEMYYSPIIPAHYMFIKNGQYS